MTPKPQANKTIDEILKDNFSDHEDSDHSICESQYVTCSVCYERIYYLNTHYHIKHTAISLFKPNECNCSFGEIVKETTKQIKALLTEARENERQAMLDALPLMDMSVESGRNKEDPFVRGYNTAKLEIKSAIKLRGGPTM